MHVKVKRITGAVISTRTTKQGFTIRSDDPKDGYWRVVWVRKRKGVKNVSGTLSLRKAETLAKLLNSLSGRDVALVVKSLHTGGVEGHRDRQRKNPSYSGRSFAWD
jgi:hypothetical protein